MENNNTEYYNPLSAALVRIATLEAIVARQANLLHAIRYTCDDVKDFWGDLDIELSGEAGFGAELGIEIDAERVSLSPKKIEAAVAWLSWPSVPESLPSSTRSTILAALALAERFAKAGRYTTQAGSPIMFINELEETDES